MCQKSFLNSYQVYHIQLGDADLEEYGTVIHIKKITTTPLYLLIVFFICLINNSCTRLHAECTQAHKLVRHWKKKFCSLNRSVLYNFQIYSKIKISIKAKLSQINIFLHTSLVSDIYLKEIRSVQIKVCMLTHFLHTS